MRTIKLFAFALLLLSSRAWAGRGGSQIAIQAAADSGSVETIIAEVQRAEFLACLGCIDTVKKLIDHPSDRVRQVAGWWLTKRGVRSDVMASMIARLQGQDPIAARNATDVLRGLLDVGAVPALSTYLAHPLDEDSGAGAARAIGEIGYPQGLPGLTGALSSPLAGVRRQSLASIRDLRQPQLSTITAIVPLLADADAGVRQQAALTIGYLGAKQGDQAGAVAALSPVATSDGAASVRKAAVWALGELRAGNAAPALTAAQSDPDPLVRSVATAALGNLK
jgi:HEAT repeat protein